MLVELQLYRPQCTTLRVVITGVYTQDNMRGTMKK
jgi:hypothetical protein